MIPTRKNAQPWNARRLQNSRPQRDSAGGQPARPGDLDAVSGHHRRSLVETKMRCFKLLGEMVMARNFERLVAELQERAAVLNHFTHLGIPVTLAVA